MPPILLTRPDGWLIAGAPDEWPRPPDPHPTVSLVAWARTTRSYTAAYVAWLDVDSWMARSRGGHLAAKVLYTRWVPAERLRPAVGIDYSDVRRLRLHGTPDAWPTPAVGPDGEPWYGAHRVYPPVPELVNVV